MRYRPLIIIFGVFLGVLATQHLLAPKERVPWRHDFAAAQSESHTTHKPIFLCFTATWCGPCQEMKKTTWASREVERALDAYTPEKIDVDEQPQLAKRYGVDSVPTLLILNDSGEVQRKMTGGLTTPDFLKWLREG